MPRTSLAGSVVRLMFARNPWMRKLKKYQVTSQLKTKVLDALTTTDLLSTIYDSYTYHISRGAMGIVKIDDELHAEIRKASSVMVRSINAQAEYWIKVGMLAEANPGMSFSDIMRDQMKLAEVDIRKAVGG